MVSPQYKTQMLGISHTEIAAALNLSATMRIYSYSLYRNWIELDHRIQNRVVDHRVEWLDFQFLFYDSVSLYNKPLYLFDKYRYIHQISKLLSNSCLYSIYTLIASIHYTQWLITNHCHTWNVIVMFSRF